MTPGGNQPFHNGIVISDNAMLLGINLYAEGLKPLLIMPPDGDQPFCNGIVTNADNVTWWDQPFCNGIVISTDVTWCMGITLSVMKL